MGESSCFVFQRGQKMIILGVILPFLNQWLTSFLLLASRASFPLFLSSVEEYHFLEKQIDLTKRLDRFRDIEIVGK